MVIIVATREVEEGGTEVQSLLAPTCFQGESGLHGTLLKKKKRGGKKLGVKAGGSQSLRLSLTTK